MVMASRMHSSTRRAWLLLATTMAIQAQGLSQTYCSNQNTGADYQGGRDESDPLFDGGHHANNGPVNDIYNSNGACQKQCQGSYAFAIVQWQNCWCSNYIPAQQDDTGSCNQQCPGYPDEHCGNQDDGMYGYIQLSNAPSGTMGASSNTQPSSTAYSSPPQIESSSPPPPPSSSTSAPTSAPPSTETSIVSQTVVSTVTEEHTQSADTVVSTVTPTPTPSSSSPDYSSTVASSTEPSSTSHTTHHSASPTPVVSTRVVTVSGQQITQTVTSTPFVAPGSDEQQQTMSRSGLSGGAIAGIVIGTLIGIAALILAGFLLWRRKKQQDTENGGSSQRAMKRNTSVLSKTGLLSRGAAARPTSMAENNYDDGNASARHSMLFGGAGAMVEPSSPLGGSQDNSASSRRHSRPMVYDQRLNPSALFANADANGSRVSMQDTQDYSRPLGVANPDLRSSFDSRWSGR